MPETPQSLVPVQTPTQPKGLAVHQIRVLLALTQARGPISRVHLGDKIGMTSIRVGKAVGRSEPEARTKFENSQDGGFRPSLLTLGYVEEVIIDKCGLKVLTVQITKSGRAALEALGPIELPPIRSSYSTDEPDDETELIE